MPDFAVIGTDLSEGGLSLYTLRQCAELYLAQAKCYHFCLLIRVADEGKKNYGILSDPASHRTPVYC